MNNGQRIIQLFDTTPKAIVRNKFARKPESASKVGPSCSAQEIQPKVTFQSHLMAQFSQQNAFNTQIPDDEKHLLGIGSRFGQKRKHSPGIRHARDDSDFLEQSSISVSLARVIDQEMRRKVEQNPRLIYQITPKVSANYWAVFDGHK